MSKKTRKVNEGEPERPRPNWSPELEERLRRADEEVRRTGKAAPVFPELVVEDEEDDDVQQPEDWPAGGGDSGQ